MASLTDRVDGARVPRDVFGFGRPLYPLKVAMGWAGAPRDCRRRAARSFRPEREVEVHPCPRGSKEEPTSPIEAAPEVGRFS
jgi:hypothetical protein